MWAALVPTMVPAASAFLGRVLVVAVPGRKERFSKSNLLPHQLLDSCLVHLRHLLPLQQQFTLPMLHSGHAPCLLKALVTALVCSNVNIISLFRTNPLAQTMSKTG